MIAEFELDGQKVVFDFQYNPDAFVRDWKNRPACDYCQKVLEGYSPIINPGHPNAALMSGWARVGGKMLPKQVSFENPRGLFVLCDTIFGMTVVYIALAASVATFIGGTFALRFRDKLHLVLGFSAGAVAGVALFDLLPEAIGLGTKYHSAATIALFIAFGFFGYLILDRLILLHTHEEDDESNAPRGFFGALTLSAHSFLDGVAIGVGFQASAAIGIVVAIAVLTHDFSDGINTVNFVLHNGGSWRNAFKWLLVDAAAPVAGAASTLLFRIPESFMGLILAIFVGTFLYLSASDLIPESHHRHPRLLTTIMTLLGALVLYTVVHLV